jgi:hypothetical protein
MTSLRVSGAFREGDGSLRRVSMIRSGHDLAQWVRSSLASQRPRLTHENLIQEENTDQIVSDLADHATNPAALI